VTRLTPALGLLLAALALPAPARAQDAASPIEPLSPGATVAAHTAIAFKVRTTAPAGSVVVRVAGSPQLLGSGLLRIAGGRGVDLQTAPGADPDVHVARAPASFLAGRRPGPYFWQAYVTGDAAATAEEPIGPVEEVAVTGPKPSSAPLFPRFGPRGRASFFLSSAHFPASVGGARFGAVVRAAARRWHLHAKRWTSLAAGTPDGFDVVGFGHLPSGVLGLETDYTAGGRLVEQDVRFNAAVPWNEGPGYPDFDEMDLQSVVLHELGHMAGVKRHAARCANTPMVAGLGLGEWWRSPSDDWFFGCGADAAAAALPAWRFASRTVALDRR
jgi:hypothetical protein